MFVFPLIFIAAFIASAKQVLSGEKQGFFLFLIFGLSIYNTTMSTAYILGFKQFIPFLQFFKESLVLTLLTINIYTLKTRPRLHIIDYLILCYLGITILYAVIPLGGQSFIQRIFALKSLSFFIIVYLAGRLMDIRKIYVNKYFSYILIVTIAAGLIAVLERIFKINLQNLTGFSEYAYYFFNFESSGNYGLNWTFESEGGIRRFASFFSDPIEHGIATLFALSVILTQFTKSNKEFKPSGIGILALLLSFCSIVLSFSRAAFAGYFIIIYVYALIFKNRLIIKIFHFAFFAGALYILFLISSFGSKIDGLSEVIINSLNFSNPSSVGHLLQWIEGVLAMIDHPLGMGLGGAGRVGGSLSEVVGGENQFIIIGVQAGVIALALYLAIYIMFIKQALKWTKILEGKESKICLVILFLKIGLIISAFTTEVEASSYISYMNWFLSGIFVSIITMHQQHSPVTVYAVAHKLIKAT